ncbi:hypothetical protein Pan258_02260 [Symmachiella dynata]|nr:hypothetical protein Pan258_02260 [Symmachiella dynata]
MLHKCATLLCMKTPNPQITVFAATEKYGLVRRTVYNRAKAGAPHSLCQCGKMLLPDDKDIIEKYYK